MRITPTILAGVIFLMLSVACRTSGADVTPVEAKIKAGALVVDVRTPAEFAAGAYPGALNIPLDQVKHRLAEFGDPKRSIVVYCRSGNRSGVAKTILENSGFSDVANGGGLRSMPPR